MTAIRRMVSPAVSDILLAACKRRFITSLTSPEPAQLRPNSPAGAASLPRCVLFASGPSHHAPERYAHATLDRPPDRDSDDRHHHARSEPAELQGVPRQGPLRLQR